jgi:Uma2 family endonuclease
MKTLQTLSRHSEEYPNVGSFSEKDMSEDGLAVSEAEYWEKYYHLSDFHYEWNNGYLEEKPMTDYRGSQVYQWFLILLKQFLAGFPIAKMIGLEFGFRLALPHKTSIRKPDLGVVLNNNPVMLGDTEFSYKGTFDLCIESLSYSKKKEILRDMVEKKKEYQGIGVKEYYILDARGEKTAFYRLADTGRYRKIRPVGKEIIRSEVLPGFQFRVSDLYRQPSLEEMTDDEVYQGYVLPFYQKVKIRAEQAEERAEYLARKLKELGVEI